MAGDYARWWSADVVREHERLQLRDNDQLFQRNLDSLTFNVLGNTVPVKIFVEKAAKISGRVVDPDGNPVAGATVAPAKTGSGNSLTGDTRYSVPTKDDGTFEMRLPATGNARYNLVVHDGKYQEWRNWANGIGEVIQTRPGQSIENVELKLTRPAVIRGKVTDAAGKPMFGQIVRAQAADKLENRYYDPETKTNEKGEFEFKFVRAGEHFVQVGEIYANTDGPQSLAWMKVTVNPDKPLEEIVLTPEARLKALFLERPVPPR